MPYTCESCGGTGADKDDDVCIECEGLGEIPEKCAQFEHVPNRTGHCMVCGYEVVTEVDDDGNPKLD